MSRLPGKVKWFSNRKGYGFIIPTAENTPTEEVIFVHQTGIKMEGDYRTLAADAVVEYEIETEEDGKVKAVNVTGPGGALIKQPPRRERRPRRNGKKENAENEDGDLQESAASKKESKVKGGGRNTPPFHDVIDSEVKEKIEASGLSLGRKTVVDIAMGDSRFRLGQEGYASEVVATGKVGEGTFACDAAGVVTFTWERALEFVDEKWVAGGMKTLTTSVSLASGGLAPVENGETMESLWGKEKADPKDDLAENGFTMKKVTISRARRAPFRRRNNGNKKKTADEEPKETEATA